MKLNFAYTKCEITVVDAEWPGECRANDALNGQITDAPVLCRPQERGRAVCWSVDQEARKGRREKEEERYRPAGEGGGGELSKESEKERAT